MARTQITGQQIADGTNGVLLGTDTTGTLPVTQGGTGSGTQNFLDLTTAQTKAGALTLSNTLTVNGAINATADITAGPAAGTVAQRLYAYMGPNGVAGTRAYIYADYTNAYVGTTGAGNIIMDNAYNEARCVAIQELGSPFTAFHWWYDGTSGTGTGVWFALPTANLNINMRLGDAAGSSKFLVKTNAGANVAAFDSAGNGSVATSLTVNTKDVLRRDVSTVTTTVTLAAVAGVDYVVFLSTGASVTLPTCVGNSNRYTLKNIDTVAKTISTTSGQLIDGTTTITIAPGASVDVVSDSANWRPI